MSTGSIVVGGFSIGGSGNLLATGGYSFTQTKTEGNPVGVRLAQIFDVHGGYVPTKATIYLRSVALDNNTYFDLSESTVIDATNFVNIEQSGSVLIFEDTRSNFTGNGYLISREFDDGDPVVTYPIKTDEPGRYYLYLRAGTNDAPFLADILLDGKKIDEMSTDGTEDWQWDNIDLVLPDSEIHDLSIKTKGNGNLLDKIYITKNSSSPSILGPDYTESPYITVHLQMYSVDDSGQLLGALDIYDYKTTLDDIKRDDWYNFDLNTIDDNISIETAQSFALVLSTTGSKPKNHILWDLVDNDEYQIMPSAIRVIND